jgi:uncharacterized iron-regulated protein
MRLLQSLALVPQILLLASKIHMYLDVWVPLVLSRKENSVFPLIIIEEENLGDFSP